MSSFLWVVIPLLVALCILALIQVMQFLFRRELNRKRFMASTKYPKVHQVIQQRLQTKKSLGNRLPRKIFSKTKSLIKTIEQSTTFPLSTYDELILLQDGEETFPSLWEAIRQAKHHIHILFYTIANDKLGEQLTKLLLEKKREGVEIRLLIDGVGSRQFARSPLYQELKQAGILCAVFSPIRWAFLLQLNQRNHRKIMVVDGRIGFTGGLNIGKEYLHQDPAVGYWRDLHVRLTGEGVLFFNYIFALDWFYATNSFWPENTAYFPQLADQQSGENKHSAKKQRNKFCQVVPSGPDQPIKVNHQIYAALLSSAQKKVCLATPYFVPSRIIMTAITKLRQRGVEVTLLVPEKPDNLLVQYAAYAYFRRLLKIGVNIYIYTKGFYHAKVCLIDDNIAVIGSVNLDQRSFRHSFESNLFVYDQQFVKTLQAVTDLDLQHTYLFTEEMLAKQSLTERLGTSVALLFIPLL